MTLLYFTNEHSLTLAERQVYSGSPSKSVFTTVSGLAGKVYLRTLNEEQTAVNGLQWGQGFSIVYETALDIRVGDRLTIDGIVYVVKGTLTNSRGRILDYSKALLTKPTV